jgi:ribose transport system ATP-binding protein
MAKAGNVVLTLRGISKRFGGTPALREVDLDLRCGEILALLGENGAGKSTLIKILAGVQNPDAGEILYRGEVVDRVSKKRPMAFVHQDLGLIEWMTVSENICLSLGYPSRWGLIDHKAGRRRAVLALQQIGADIDPDGRVESLSRTEKSLVAISRALASDSDVIVLDEPTASLPNNDVKRVFNVLERLRARGVAMIYVSHRIDEVFQIANRIVVLRDGEVVAQREVNETSANELILLIVGKRPADVSSRSVDLHGDVRLILEALALPGVGPVSCRFHRGEVVGLFGLRGAGHENIGRALFGLLPIVGGSIRLDGRLVAPCSPNAAMKIGIELIWGDRLSGSIFPTMSVRENMFLNITAGGASEFFYISPRREQGAALELGRKVSLRPNRPELAVEALSGGNQQKVVVGRWLRLEGKVYVFEDPTSGVDVGAKADIYALFDVVLGMGATILLISTDFEEVAKVCHRVLVFDRGQVVSELSGAELTPEKLLAEASAGGALTSITEH